MTAARIGARCSTGSPRWGMGRSRWPSASRPGGHRPERPGRHLRRHGPPEDRVGQRCPCRPVQVDRRRGVLGAGRLRLPGRQHRQRGYDLRHCPRHHQLDHRRPGELVRALPRHLLGVAIRQRRARLDFGTGSDIGDVRSLVLDRSSRRRARNLYAGISGHGVFQSTDGGNRWTRILSKNTHAVAHALAAVSGAAMTQVVLDLAPPASPPRSGIQVIYAAIGGSTKALDPVGLFVSTDQGRTWSEQAASGLSPRDDPGRVLPGARRRPGIARGRRKRRPLPRLCGTGPVHGLGQNFTQLAACTRTPTPGASSPRPRRRRRSCTAPPTAGSGDPATTA